MTRDYIFRKYQKEKIIHKIYKRYSSHGWYSEEDALMAAKKEADNRVRFKCDCCSNPRKSRRFRHRLFEKLTLQEQKDLDVVKSSLEEIENFEQDI